MSDFVKRLRDAAVMDPDYGPTVRMDIFDYGIVIAIADRIEALEAALRKAQERFTQIIDNTNNGLTADRAHAAIVEIEKVLCP